VPVAETIRYSAKIVMLLAAELPLVPALVRAVYEAPAVNVSLFGPSSPTAPIKSSSAWLVAAVVPDDGEVLVPLDVVERSSPLLVASPEKSPALSARAVTDGWVTVIVPPTGMVIALCAARMTVRTPLPFVTSASAVYVFPAESEALTVPAALSIANAIITLWPVAMAVPETVSASEVPAVLLDVAPMDCTNEMAANALRPWPNGAGEAKLATVRRTAPARPWRIDHGQRTSRVPRGDRAFIRPRVRFQARVAHGDDRQR